MSRGVIICRKNSPVSAAFAALLANETAAQCSNASLKAATSSSATAMMLPRRRRLLLLVGHGWLLILHLLWRWLLVVTSAAVACVSLRIRSKSWCESWLTMLVAAVAAGSHRSLPADGDGRLAGRSTVALTCCLRCLLSMRRTWAKIDSRSRRVVLYGGIWFGQGCNAISARGS